MAGRLTPNNSASAPCDIQKFFVLIDDFDPLLAFWRVVENEFVGHVLNLYILRSAPLSFPCE